MKRSCAKAGGAAIAVAVTAAVLAAAVAAACARGEPRAPAPSRVEPREGLLGASVPVTIRGGDFWLDVAVSFSCAGASRVGDTFQARLGDTVLGDVLYVDDATLSAVVPPTLPLGVYDLTVTDPAGRTAVLPAAFAVVTMLGTDAGGSGGDGGGGDGGPDAGGDGGGGDGGGVGTDGGVDGGGGTDAAADAGSAPPQCANGVDDDGDTAIDFPADPGCADAADDDETNTVPPETCAPEAALIAAPGTVVSGMVNGSFGDDFTGTCGGAGAPDVVYSIALPAGAAALQIATDLPGTNYDTLLYLRDDCAVPGSEILCDDDSGIATQSMLLTGPLAPGTYFLVVDGFSGGGAYEASIDVILPPGAACTPGSTGFRCLHENECAPAVAGGFTCQPTGCAVVTTLMGPGPFSFGDTTVGRANLHAGSCGQGGDGGTRAPEAIFVLSLAAPVTNVHVTTDFATTTFDTLVYVRDGCTGVEIVCDDDGGANTTSVLDTGPLAAGSYYLFVDGFATNSGPFDTVVTVSP
ncbi:MAG TPA: hypothetical protein VG389_23800 [Myxococcota bacterium]|jgi:hypothetical protein|nr:hypothetical protein [Myxococcota bacterium]